MGATGQLIKRTLGMVPKTPGAIVGFAGATTLGLAGGAIKATGQGLVAGAKAAKGLKRKILGEVAEEASETTTKLAKPIKNYRNNTSFAIDGASYRINGDAYQRKLSDGAWENITSKEYGHSRASFIGHNEALEQAALNAESGAGAWSGIGNFVHEHPAIAAGIAGGVGVAGGALLFGDDDDDY